MNYHDYFIYDNQNGGLIWKERPASMFEVVDCGFVGIDLFQWKTWNKKNAGKRAGHIENNGYERVKLGGKKISVHRIVWEMHHGKITNSFEIDHVDRNRSNNKLENLRKVTRNQNQRNVGTQKNNKLGFKGVYYCEVRDRYIASSQCKGAKFQRTFKTLDEAVSAIKKFRLQHGISD